MVYGMAYSILFRLIPGFAFIGKGKKTLSACCLFRTRLSVAAHELIHATGGVDELGLTSVERMRRARDFQLYYGIGFAFELNGVVGLTSGTGEEHIAIAHVLEDNGAVVLGVDSFFHFAFAL